MAERSQHATRWSSEPHHSQRIRKRSPMPRIENVIYTGKMHTTGGRDGASHSDDGRLDVKLSPPGSSGPGTNPEQLFAAGWSACFMGAIRKAAAVRKVAIP